MPLDKLRNQILDDAKRKAEELEKEAKRQAETMVRHARERAKQIEENAGKEMENEMTTAREEQNADIELQERGLMLDAREKLVDALMPRIRSMTLRRLKKEGYWKLINLAIREAGAIAPQEELTLVVNKKDARLVKQFAGRIKYGDVGNGVELYTRKGSIKIAANLEKLFEEKESAIRTVLMKEISLRSAAKNRGRRRAPRPKKARRKTSKKR